MMTTTAVPLPQSLLHTIHKIKAMREYTERSGFHTTRSEKEILGRLAADDLAAVLLALRCPHLNFEIVTPGRAVCVDCGLESRAEEG